MKKIAFAITSLCLLLGTAFGQTILVTNPEASSDWQQSRRYYIEWSKTGQMSDKVSIELRSEASTNAVHQIAGNLDNNGYYRWLIPGSVSPGNYVIRVKTVTGDTYGDSRVFKISERTQERPSGTAQMPAEARKGITEKPDLYVGALTITPRFCRVGDQIVFRARIFNRGGGCPATTGQLLVQGPENFNKNYPLMIPKIGPGKYYDFELGTNWRIAGKYVNTIKLDISNNVAEKREDNNEGSLTYNVGKELLPDLTVKFEWKYKVYPSHVTDWVRVEVINLGSKESPPSKLEFYIKGKGKKYYDIPALQPRQSKTVTRKVSSALVDRRKRKCRARADYGNRIRESNEDNNKAEMKI